MKTVAMAAGAGAILFTAGAVSTAAAAGPPRPIPYTVLDEYLAASSRERASRDWWSGQAMAATGSSANVSATTGAGADAAATTPPAAMDPTGSGAPAMPGASGSMSGATAPPSHMTAPSATTSGTETSGAAPSGMSGQMSGSTATPESGGIGSPADAGASTGATSGTPDSNAAP